MRIPLLARPVLLLVAAKVAATLLVIAHHGSVPERLHLAYIVCFAGAALLLFATGAEDIRATNLGGFYLAVAASFCRTTLGQLSTGEEGFWGDLATLANTLKPEAFLPYFLWSFVRVFPETPVPRRIRRLLSQGTLAVAWLSGFLFVVNLISFPTQREPGIGRFLQLFNPNQGLYDYLLILPLLPPPLMLLYKIRRTRQDEGRRARLFGTAFLVALAPALIELTAELSFGSYVVAQRQSAVLHNWVQGIVALFLLPLPFSTAYAVLAYRVLPVRLIARRALQYALARYLSYVLAAVPFVALVLYIYTHGDSRVRDLWTGNQVLLFLAAALLGFAAQRYRGYLLESIDRRFFREQYDARQILTLMVERIRGTHEIRDLAELLCHGIDEALHLSSIATLIEDPRSGNFVDPRSRARKLDASAGLAHRLAASSDPLTIDLDNPRSALLKLAEVDRAWLSDARFRLLVPIVARDGSLLGLIGLGEKRSGLPFLREDKKLLIDIANSASLGLELDLKRTASTSSHDDTVPGLQPEPASTNPPENAKECLSCGALYLPYTVFCGNCSRRLEPSVVPFVLPGKFRFERRLGAGGMGVVYRGIDLGLGRAVAVKTLKRVSPEDAMRLRREARTAAAVSHPHLAAVYGLETWQGTPLLVMELMEGGTLTQRIEKGPHTARQTVELGISMAAALEHLHAADILHRDIKPGNIGYTRDGTPKLMDFGIARVLLDLGPERSTAIERFEDDDSESLLPTSIWNHSSTSVTLSRQFAGTLSYLSPEALNSERPNTSFDLWSLAVVLYECVLGRKLFAGMDMKQVMARIRQGRVPDYEQTLPQLDPALGQFLRSALHRTQSRRPASARDLRYRLEEVRVRLTEPRQVSPAGPGDDRS